MERRFRERCKQILIGLCEEEPVEGTYLGIHNFDSLLPLTDRLSRGIYRYQKGLFLSGLEEFEDRRDELSDEAQLDLDILVGYLKARLRIDSYDLLHERRADYYPTQALEGIYILAMRDYLPLKERMESITYRLIDTPRLLDEGMTNLRSGANIPSVWTEMGLKITQLGTEFFEYLVPKLSKLYPDNEEKILGANKKAIAAFKRYASFLKKELMGRSHGNYAIGGESFNYLLKHKHMLTYDAAELRDIGERLVKKVQEHLAKHARQIDPQRSWREQISDLKRRHPGPEKLLESYSKQVDKARRFVEEKGLVTIPEEQELLVRETPPFQRMLIPYAAFIPPPPFEKRQEGILWITPVNGEYSLEEQEERLREHCSWGIPVTALHETFPGHHLQLCRANSIKSPVRRQIATPVFIEGWALYCEEMMKEQGFISDPRTILMQLRDQLWRAVRIVIDVGLHCFGMEISEAVDTLVNVVGLSRENALAEVKRYTISPTQPMSYMIGKLEIMKLRKEIESLDGDDFDLRSFHDELLDFGSIPISLIRRAMLDARQRNSNN